MRNLNTLDWVAFVLLIIGGINWGMIGIFNIDLVGSLFGSMTGVVRAVYVLVGISAIYTVFTLSTKV